MRHVFPSKIVDSFAPGDGLVRLCQTPERKTMEQLNRIELRGTVGFVRQQTVNGRMVAHLSVATNYVYKDRNGEPVIETTWHNVSAWEGKNSPDLAKIEKGCGVNVVGRLRSQRYTDSEGIERYAFDVIAYQVTLIEDPSPFQYEFVG